MVGALRTMVRCICSSVHARVAALYSDGSNKGMGCLSQAITIAFLSLPIPTADYVPPGYRRETGKSTQKTPDRIRRDVQRLSV